ncbi:MAG: Ig-like domain-containing protein [Limnochordia bacterium]|jgi:hypothetical protein|nr:MAG: hypothetical protein AA931_11805 [Peptococcaceae bacterium 1109]
MRKLHALLLSVVLVIALVGGAATTATASKLPTTVVLDFLAINDQGEYIEPTLLQQADLINLSRVMAQGIAARLVQFGEFDVVDNTTLLSRVERLPYERDASAYERAAALFQAGIAEEVITGSITLLQNTAVVGVQRFQNAAGVPALVGSSMANTSRVADAPSLIDKLISELFPPDVQVIERSIEQVFTVPSQLRMNLGSSYKITAYALDSMGRPIPEPEFLYFSSDESKIEVTEDGTIRALQPGTATVTVRAIGRTARSGSPATMTVTVIPPALGVRVGTIVTNREGIEGRPMRLGLRLTPAFEQRNLEKQVPTADGSNPLSFISSFFSSLLTNGLITIDVDFDPTRELLFAFSGVQRSVSGFIGTGVGYITPFEDISSEQGFLFRFTMGTQYRPGSRVAIPVEAVMDAIFPTTDAFKPSFRIGINVGLDLFP